MSSLSIPMPAVHSDVAVTPLTWLVLGLTCLLLLTLCLLRLVGRPSPVTRLQIVAPFVQLAPQTVAAAAAPALRAGVLDIDLDAVQSAVAALPWVARVRAERAWPDGVRLRVWERQAFARWNGSAALDTQAQPFIPAAGELPATLPQLVGVAGRERQVMNAYAQLSTALSSSPFALAGLTLDARGEWTAQTLNGIEIRLGQAAPDQHLDKLRTTVAQQLAGRVAEVRYVDVRYGNGFAVGWVQQGGGERPPDVRPAGDAASGTPSPGQAPEQQSGDRNG